MGTGYGTVTDSTGNPNPAPGEDLDFGQALDVLRDGGKVARAGWNGTGMWVCLSPGFTLPAAQVFATPIKVEIAEGVGSFRSYLMMRTVDGEFVPWVASQTDLLANDWRVVR